MRFVQNNNEKIWKKNEISAWQMASGMILFRQIQEINKNIKENDKYENC